MNAEKKILLSLNTLIILSCFIAFINVIDAQGGSATLTAWGNNNSGQTNYPSGLTNCYAVAAGAYHSIAVLDTGRVIGWGNNEVGQLNIPMQATNVVAVSAGYAHTVALRGDGTVVAWGQNDSGQTNVPSNLSGVVKIVSGDNFNLALLSNGRIVGWGGPSYGTSPSKPPSYLTDGSMPVIAIGAGSSFGMAVDAYGRVHVWGTTDPRVLQIPYYLTNFQYRAVAVAGGTAHCLALLDNGAVVGWGDNYYGQANGLSGAKAVFAGGNTSGAIMQDNTARIWGDNTHRQLNPPITLTNIAVLAPGSMGHCLALYYEPVKITYQPQSLAVIQGGSAVFTVSANGSQPIYYQWKHQGTNIPYATNYILNLYNIQSNQAGAYTVVASNMINSVTSDSATLTVRVPPIIISQPTNQSIPLGGNAQFGVTVQGTSPFFYQWRKNGTNIGVTVNPYIILNAQASDAGYYSVVVTNIAGSTTSAVAQLIVNLPPSIITHPKSQTVPVGASVTFTVIDSGGAAYQWRKNGLNITGATNSSYSISSVKSEDAGYYSVIVSNQGGSVTSQSALLTVVESSNTQGMITVWGEISNMWNGYEYVNVLPPGGLTNISRVAAGGYHCLALLRNGKTIGWGDNRYGQSAALFENVKAIAAGLNHSLVLFSNGAVYVFGDSSYGQTNTPSGLTNIVAIAAGLNHCLALRSNGSVVGWGNNTYGQATPLPGLSNVVAIAAGAEHSLALKSNGVVVAWGRNDDGQTRVPSSLTNVVGIAAGEGHSLALLSNGRVIGWGRNNYGQSTPPEGLSNVMAISAGKNHSVALLSNNTVVCWGANNYGQLEQSTNIIGAAFISAGPNYTIATVLKPLKLSIAVKEQKIYVRNHDYTSIEDWRVSYINLYQTTNIFDSTSWIKNTSSPNYSSGALIFPVSTTNIHRLFYRIIEIP
ncbi:MAG: immunoglobulin domain-containing protein [Verrucomicrobiae bacterium]|nr:immunoglobulin domain-containing protein [Verrucomicrobiae bacterium]